MMTKRIPIMKFTSNGNNFVVIDETDTPILSEVEKVAFAQQATDVNFGVGSDNLLVLQPSTQKVLGEINEEHRYWKTLPDGSGADYIFRMFESNGDEAFSCANGLMCVAKHLRLRYGKSSARILTEIPAKSPKVVSVGTNQKGEIAWANMGHPRRIPNEVANHEYTIPFGEMIDMVKGLPVQFREHDLLPFSQERTLELSGFLVFTGEPHLVLFPDTGFSLTELAKLIFVPSHGSGPAGKQAERRRSFGSWLIERVGMHLNKEHRSIFPAGININFVQMNEESEVLEYRCFERGICHETLACGTGAVAVCCTAREMGLLDTDEIVLWPHRCRWHDNGGQIVVRAKETGMEIYSKPVFLLEGDFMSKGGGREETDSVTSHDSVVGKWDLHMGEIPSNIYSSVGTSYSRS